jgi:feruloyl esterase
VKGKKLALLLSVLALIFFGTPCSFADACSNISTRKLKDTTILNADMVTAGAVPSLPGLSPDIARQLPAFCRVALKAAPSTDSDIEIEVWMPVSGWNGKFLGRGNGGYAGIISYQEMAMGVIGGGGRQYARAALDYRR